MMNESFFDYTNNLNLAEDLINSLPYNSLFIDNQGKIILKSNNWENFFKTNFDREQILDNIFNITQFIQLFIAEKSKITQLNSKIYSVLSGSSKYISSEFLAKNKLWYKIKVNTFNSGALILFNEITAEKKYQNKLELTKYAVDYAPIAIFQMDSEGNLEYANQTAVDWHGYTIEELKNSNLYQNLLIDAPERKVIWNKLKKEGKFNVKGKHKTKFGDIIDVDVTSSYLKFQGEEHEFVFIKDITEKIKLENRIKKMISELNKQFEKARILHSNLLPSNLKKLDNYKIEAYYQPANKLGGDFYDLIELKDHLIFYVSDVSGHDLSSSMVNVFLKEAINSYLSNLNLQLFKKNMNKISPQEILEHVREEYQEADFPVDYFITILLGVLDKKTGKFKVSNAGSHLMPILLKSEQGAAVINTKNQPITSYFSMAVELGIHYQDVNFKLEKNDSLIFLTDGLIEQSDFDKNYYGEERLFKLLSSNLDKNPAEIIELINNDFDKFKGKVKLQDDLTYLIMKRI